MRQGLDTYRGKVQEMVDCYHLLSANDRKTALGILEDIYTSLQTSIIFGGSGTLSGDEDIKPVVQEYSVETVSHGDKDEFSSDQELESIPTKGEGFENNQNNCEYLQDTLARGDFEHKDGHDADTCNKFQVILREGEEQKLIHEIREKLNVPGISNDGDGDNMGVLHDGVTMQSNESEPKDLSALRKTMLLQPRNMEKKKKPTSSEKLLSQSKQLSNQRRKVGRPSKCIKLDQKARAPVDIKDKKNRPNRCEQECVKRRGRRPALKDDKHWDAIKEHVEVLLADSVASKLAKDSEMTVKKANFKCLVCGHTATSKASMQAHQYNIHFPTRRPFQCDQCGKCFGSPYKLRRHQRTHSKEKQYLCDQCTFSTNTSVGLYNHRVNIHGNRPDLCCSHCSFKTHYQRHLNFHIQGQHSNQESFHCQQCSKAFPGQHQLQMHVRTHLEPCVICDICGKKFHDRYKLKRHSVSHTGQREFPCTQCIGKFTTKWNLDKHIQDIHMQESLSADILVNDIAKRINLPLPLDHNNSDFTTACHSKEHGHSAELMGYSCTSSFSNPAVEAAAVTGHYTQEPQQDPRDVQVHHDQVSSLTQLSQPESHSQNMHAKL